MAGKSESRIQQECVMWFWNTYPTLRGLFFHVNNNGANGRHGHFLKQIGVVAGVSDTLLIYGGTVWCFEFKKATGTQQPEQIKWQQKVEKQGIQYFIVRDLSLFQRLIKSIIK